MRLLTLIRRGFGFGRSCLRDDDTAEYSFLMIHCSNIFNSYCTTDLVVSLLKGPGYAASRLVVLWDRRISDCFPSRFLVHYD